MLRIALALAPALFALVSLPAFAEGGKELLTCTFAGGGTVTVEATNTSKYVNLVFDDFRASQFGVARADKLAAVLETDDGASTAAPLDLMEIGSFADGKGCGLGLEFNDRNQKLGDERDVALKPSRTYNVVECGGKRDVIESCTLGKELVDVDALKNFIHTEVAD
jgi:hypothetical protein